MSGRPLEAASPFSLDDYLQIAQMGRRSVALHVVYAGHEADLVIRDGEAWYAKDEDGEGEPALRRILRAGAVSGQARVEVDPSPVEAMPRNLHVPLQATLLDVARACDEGRDEEEATVSSRPPRPDLPFEAWYERAVEAILARDYADAAEAFAVAAELRPNHQMVATNLARLKELGFEAL